MKIEILATDSLGVRSMATRVIAGGRVILIDPGAALGPKRYGLPPHPKELEKLRLSKEVIKKAAKDAEIIVITHYHFDHYDPEDAELYRGKKLYIKDPEKNINLSQRKRAAKFLNLVENVAAKIEVAEEKSVDLGGARIVFSYPCPHGEGPRLGYVVQVLVEEKNEKFLFTSDIQGAPCPEQLEFILSVRPDVIFMDGPPTYLSPKSFSISALESSLESMGIILKDLKPRAFIVDHHSARDKKYKEKLGLSLITGAEFMNLKPEFLEAMRKELWKQCG